MKSVRKFQLGKAWLLPLLLVTALAFAGCAAPAAPAPAPAEEAAAPAEEAADPYVTVFGETLPEGAAPYEEQVLRMASDPTLPSTTFDFFAAVYQRYCHSDYFSNTFGDPLVELDTDFNLVPASRKLGSIGRRAAGTFRLRPDRCGATARRSPPPIMRRPSSAPARNTPGTSPGYSTASLGRAASRTGARPLCEVWLRRSARRGRPDARDRNGRTFRRCPAS